MSPDRRGPGHRNLFSGSPLDRRADLRGAPDAWARLLSGRAHKIVPVSEAGVAVAGGEQPTARLVAAGPGLDLLRQAETWALLGEWDGTCYWLVDVDSLPGPVADLEGSFVGLRKCGALLSESDAAILAHARALAHFHRRHRFCGQCGGRTRAGDLGNLRRCSNPACASTAYPRSDPAIIVLLHQGDRCILARQPGWEPNVYATIAGFVEPGESLEDALRREVKEECGLDAQAIQYHSSQPWPFPASLMIGFHAAVTGDLRIDHRELEDARWLTRAQLRHAVRAGDVVLPSPMSISFRLIDDWLTGAA